MLMFDLVSSVEEIFNDAFILLNLWTLACSNNFGTLLSCDVNFTSGVPIVLAQVFGVTWRAWHLPVRYSFLFMNPSSRQ